MRKQKTLLKTMLLIYALVASCSCLYAQEYYQKVTSTPLESGQYLIVCEGKKLCFDGSNLEVSNNYQSVTIGSNNRISATDDTKDAEFTIEAVEIVNNNNTIVKYSIMNKAGKFIGRELNDTGLDIADNAFPNTISMSSGNAIITSKNMRTLQCNSTSAHFTYDYNSQTAVQLYKRMDATIPSSVNIFMNSYGLATYASSFDLDFSAVVGLEAYIATKGSESITLTKKDVIPAGKGMLLRATGGGDKTYSIPTTTATNAQREDVSENLFVRGKGATMSSGANGVYGYILNVVDNEVGFYLANSQFVATNRSYLRIVNSNYTVSRIDLNFEGAAGINTVNDEGIKINGYYNLNGQRVDSPTKGLYIVNGKKLVMK